MPLPPLAPGAIHDWPGRERRIDRQRVREYLLTSAELGAAAAQPTMVVLLPVLLRDDAPSTLMVGFAVGLRACSRWPPFVIGAGALAATGWAVLKTVARRQLPKRVASAA